MIPVFRPSLDQEELDAVKEAFDSRWIGLGPKTGEFENQFAEYLGARHAVGVNSGSAALHLALKVLDLRPGDEVILPSLTFVSCAHAVLYCGAKPIFADVLEDTLTLDPEDVARRMTRKTRAIMPVHYGGHPCEMRELLGLARDGNVPIVEDAAHACGSEYRGKKAGTIGELGCFSFHAVKNLTTGEGGMVVTDDSKKAQRLKALRWEGISKTTWDRYAPSGKHPVARRTPSWKYEINELGYKYHMSDVAAAIGLVQLKKLEKHNARRREIARMYDEGFGDVSWITTPLKRDYVRSSLHLYVIRVKKRDLFVDQMFSSGIATSVHYFPIHLFKFYRKLGNRVRLPVTERVWKTLVTMPMFPELTDDEVQFIMKSARSFRP